MRRAERRSRVLADLARAFENADGPDERAQRLVKLLVPAFADAATVETAGIGGRPQLIAMTCADPVHHDALRELRTSHALGPDAPRGVARVMSTGDAQFCPQISHYEAAEFATDATVLELLRTLDVRSYLAVPLSDQGPEASLVLTAMTCGRRSLDQDAADLISELARAGRRGAGRRPRLRARAPDRLSAAERAAAHDPPRNPRIGLFPSGDGWILVVGDVCGKGPVAAQLTGLIRHTIRALTVQQPRIRPARLMSLLNEVMLLRDDDRFATLTIARVTRTGDGSFRLRLCSAGHPPAMHRSGPRVSQRTSRGPLIGVYPSPLYTEIECRLAPDDAIVFYTDGVIEAGRPHALFGEHQLSHVIATAHDGSGGHLLETIANAAITSASGPFRDDIAMLCLRATPTIPAVAQPA